MSESRTLSIGLPLEAFSYGPDKSKTGFRAVDRHSGQKYVIFDAKVAEAIRSVGEQSRDYGVRPSTEPGRDAVIESVPGIYTPPPRYGGGGGFRGGSSGGGGGGMTNKQVALLAASNLAPAGSQVAVVTAYAEKLMAWLVGGGEPAAAPAAPPAPQGWGAPPAPPVEVPDNPAEAAGAFIEGIGGDGSWQ